MEYNIIMTMVSKKIQLYGGLYEKIKKVDCVSYFYCSIG